MSKKDKEKYPTKELQDGEVSTKGHAFSSFFEWIEAIVTAIIVVVVIFTFMFRIVTVSGPSMQNTVQDGDKVLMTDHNYEPEDGDIVIISHGEEFSEPLIKRVIATEGQRLQIDFTSGDVYVNGKLLDEKYIKNSTITNEGGLIPSVIPAGYVFVMGDNRQNSKDSRSPEIGLIDERTILGKAQCVIYPFNHIGGLYDE